MSNRYYQAALGADSKEDIVEAGASSLTWVEVAVTYSLTGNSKMEVVKSLRAIIDYITADTWPPA